MTTSNRARLRSWLNEEGYLYYVRHRPGWPDGGRPFWPDSPGFHTLAEAVAVAESAVPGPVEWQSPTGPVLRPYCGQYQDRATCRIDQQGPQAGRYALPDSRVGSQQVMLRLVERTTVYGPICAWASNVPSRSRGTLMS